MIRRPCSSNGGSLAYHIDGCCCPAGGGLSIVVVSGLVVVLVCGGDSAACSEVEISPAAHARKKKAGGWREVLHRRPEPRLSGDERPGAARAAQRLHSSQWIASPKLFGSSSSKSAHPPSQAAVHQPPARRRLPAGTIAVQDEQSTVALRAGAPGGGADDASPPRAGCRHVVLVFVVANPQ